MIWSAGGGRDGGGVKKEEEDGEEGSGEVDVNEVGQETKSESQNEANNIFLRFDFDFKIGKLASASLSNDDGGCALRGALALVGSACVLVRGAFAEVSDTISRKCGE